MLLASLYPFLFLMLFKKSKNGPCMTCSITSVLLMVLGAFALIASLVGVLMAHFGTDQGGAVFGTVSGSLSILALIASLFFAKKMGGCCGCQCAMPSKK
jgi:hypothetical protein